MLPGELIDGRFELVRLAGAGGMGEVWKAEERATGESVALKLLRGERAADRARFEREARALVELRHPGIIRYVAHGVDAAGRPYLAMEWLEGEDLKSRLTRGPRARLRRSRPER
jgi:serine/threonine protein kinase